MMIVVIGPVLLRNGRWKVNTVVVQIKVMPVQTRFCLDKSGFFIQSCIWSAIRPRLLLGFAPRAPGRYGYLRLRLRAVVHFGQAQRTQFRFDILEGSPRISNHIKIGSSFSSIHLLRREMSLPSAAAGFVGKSFSVDVSQLSTGYRRWPVSGQLTWFYVEFHIQVPWLPKTPPATSTNIALHKPTFFLYLLMADCFIPLKISLYWEDSPVTWKKCRPFFEWWAKPRPDWVDIQAEVGRSTLLLPNTVSWVHLFLLWVSPPLRIYVISMPKQFPFVQLLLPRFPPLLYTQ